MITHLLEVADDLLPGHVLLRGRDGPLVLQELHHHQQAHTKLSQNQSEFYRKKNWGLWYGMGSARTWRRELLRRESISKRRVEGTWKASEKGGSRWYPAGRGGGGGGGGAWKTGRVCASGAGAGAG
jgi:hypothetical protein